MIIPELMTGGAQRSFSQLSRDLSEKHEVHVVIFNKTAPVSYALGGPLHSLGVSKGASVFQKIQCFIKRIRNLRKLKHKIKPDISISFLEGADYVNVLSAVGEKVVISIRGSKVHDLEISGIIGWIRKKMLIPYLYRRVDHIVTVSQNLQQELIHHFNIRPSTISTIHNYYDINEIERLANQPVRSEKLPQVNGRIVITVGRLHPGKNHKFLISIFPEIREKCPEARLVIVGDGSMRDELLALARSTGLKTYSPWHDTSENDCSIFFFGEQTNPFVFYRQSHLFVLTSQYEGFPNVLVEAMISRLPVISADCNYGPREILAPDSDSQILSRAQESDYGVLMPYAEMSYKKEWVDMISSVLNDDTRRARYSEKARQRSLAFSKEQILKKWMSLIEKN